METTVNQRWRDKVATYMQADKVFNPARFWVGELPFADAKKFVTTHHYMGSMSASRVRFGLYHSTLEDEELVGVAVFDHGMNPAILTKTFDTLPAKDAQEVTLNLARFVMLDAVKWNGETWFLARCFEELRKKGYLGVVSFSDPVVRRHEGSVTFKGHIGTIYQAHNAAYLGHSSPKTKHVFPDGREFCDRTASKARNGEVGETYACQLLIDQGADAPWDDRAEWVRHWRAKLCQRVNHPGNYKYAWWFPKKHAPEWERQKYPKVTIEL